MDKFVAGPLNLTPVFSFSSFKLDFFLMVPLGSTVSNLRPRFAPILGSYGHARSQGGHQPAAAKPPCVYIYIFAKGNVALCSITGCNALWSKIWLTDGRAPQPFYVGVILPDILYQVRVLLPVHVLRYTATDCRPWDWRSVKAVQYEHCAPGRRKTIILYLEL